MIGNSALVLAVHPSMMNVESRDRDYHRVERALDWLAHHYQQQPSLKEVADHAGLSEYHFQRVFARWVGLSPKKYVQYLTLARAKQSLDASRSVLDAAYDAGLSGPGRLHDLFVALAAVTPGEYKARGEGLSVHYGFHATPFGESLLMVSDRGMCGLAFTLGSDRAHTLSLMRKGFENAAWSEDATTTSDYARRIFSHRAAEDEAGEPPLKLLLRGTRFEVKVWEALLSVPHGALTTYSDIAQRIGSPKAVRAVGSAVAKNPVAYLIPCHRVIRKSGAIHGYRWGSGRKLAMLSREANLSPQ